MKKFHFLLSCVVAVSGVATAQTAATQSGRYAMKQAAARNEAPATQSVAANTDPKIFGMTFMDSNGWPSATYVDPSNVRNLNRLAVLDETDEQRIQRMCAGELVDGKYYGQVTLIYTFSERYAGWGSVDTNTGKFSWVFNAKEDNAYKASYLYNYMDASGELYDLPRDNYKYLDLAYNKADGKLYGLALPENADMSGSRAVFGVVSLDKGKLTPIAHFDAYCYAMTFDMEGNLYVAHRVADRNLGDSWGEQTKLVDIVRLDKADVPTQTVDKEANAPLVKLGDKKFVDLQVDGKDFRAIGLGTMTTDYSTGDMYVFIEGEYKSDNTADMNSRVFCIHPRTKEVVNLGKLGWSSDILTGAAIPTYETADAATAPAMVTNLAIAHDDAGAAELTVTWNNPASNWDLSDLTDLTSMQIAVDSKDNVVGTLPASLTTESYTYTAKGLTTGMHTIYVTAVNAAGKGVASDVAAWAGHDVPGMPGAGSVTADGKVVTVTWETPATGKNGGWFDAENVKYDIVRMPGNVELAQDVDGLSFVDNTIEKVLSYYYLITPKTADGTGVALETAKIIAGDALQTPYDIDMQDEASARAWKVWSNDYFYDCYDKQWDNGKNPSYGLKLSVDRFPVDYYFASPKIAVEAGKTYHVQFKVYFHNQVDEMHPKCYHDFELTAGTDYNNAAMESNVFAKFEHQSVPNYYYVRTIEGWFTPEATDGYSFAFHLNTASGDEDVISVQGFSIRELAPADATIEKVFGTQAPAVGRETPYDVTVSNVGTTPLTKATVQIIKEFWGEQQVLGESTVDFNLNAQEKTVVRVKAKPDVEGEQTLYAIVKAEGDADESNDKSAPIYVDVLPEGSNSYPIDLFVQGPDVEDEEKNEERSVEPDIPFGFYNKYHGYQSIYLPEDLKLDTRCDAEDINKANKIYGIAYPFVRNDYEGLQTADVTGVKVKVFMSTTTTKRFRTMRQVILPSDQQKVFDGEITIKGGDNKWVVINFDEAFEITPGENLVVTITKEGGNPTVQSPFKYTTYNKESVTVSHDKRSLKYLSNNQPMPESTAFTEGRGGGYYCGLYCNVPQMWLAVPDNTTGVEGIEIDSETGEANINNLDNADVTLYDMNGRKVYNGTVNGSINSLPVANGLYIAVVATDEAVATVKVRINR